jgi:hypothetical protein
MVGKVENLIKGFEGCLSVLLEGARDTWEKQQRKK